MAYRAQHSSYHILYAAQYSCQATAGDYRPLACPPDNRGVRGILAGLLGVASAAVVVGAAPPTPGPAVTGLDHVPIAVADLEASSARYRALGFTLKPGRPHDNGIRNQHAKFADGTELELITAPEARDGLTTTYRHHLAQGDGPAFLALFAPSLDQAAARLAEGGIPHTRRGPTLSLGAGDGLGYLFLGPRNASPTDRPGHFAHANGATSLIAVWLAGELRAEVRLLETLGARVTTAEVHVPHRQSVAVATFDEGEVLLLPSDRQLVPGRKIVGATVRVRSIATVTDLLGRNALPPVERVTTPRGLSVFLPPALTKGLWLELREPASR
jgi:catechol 2,3-dioxygenase-like lactoylglutathione lyase family enzyme